jgi:ATP-dependent Clp protease ATP-binding subunit ClpC
MFERYTEQARRALFFARYECSILGSMSIEPEHLLLGLLREPGDLTDVMPKATADAVRQQLLAGITTRPATSTSVEIPFGPDAKRALEAAAKAAEGFLHAHIGTEHLLLALAETGDTARVVAANGVDVETLRTQIRERPLRSGTRPANTPASASSSHVDARRDLTLRQIDGAVTLLRSIGYEYPGVPDAGRLVDHICRDLESLKVAIAAA